MLIVRFKMKFKSCIVILDVKHNGIKSDKLNAFNLTEPLSIIIRLAPTKALYRNVTKDRIVF